MGQKKKSKLKMKVVLLSIICNADHTIYRQLHLPKESGTLGPFEPDSRLRNRFKITI